MIDIFRALMHRRDRKRLRRFFARYAGRTLIVHQGLAIDWLEELLKLGGGAGHFRIDARHPLDGKSPVLWVTHRFILPLHLPLPVLCDIGKDAIQIRHLMSRGHLCHPADIGWILDDVRYKSRRHAVLTSASWRLIARYELPVSDNAYELDFGTPD